MAETSKTERIYTIPLRKDLLKVPQYERSGRAIKAIKKFVAKHMKVPDRDVRNVKLDVYFNNEVWFRGRANPPSKVTVKVRKEGDIVRVEFVETPEYVKFLQSKHGKRHQKSDKKESRSETKSEVKEGTDSDGVDDKVAEKEKASATEQANMKEAKLDAKADKHTAKPDKNKSHPQRMALQK